MPMVKYASLILAWFLLAPSLAEAGEVVKATPGRSVERNLSSESTSTLWARDPERVETESGDEIAEQEVVALKADTVKLRNVVPPIHFESGVANIPASYIDRLRVVLESMQHLENVRLHLVGHAEER